jgi:hypothetical protein
VQLGCSLPNKQINSYDKKFRLFENLIELRMYWYYRDTCDWSEIVKMLFNCPKLKALYIEKVCLSPQLIVIGFCLLLSSNQVFLQTLF